MRLLELYEGQNYVYGVTEAYLGGHLLQRILKKPNGRFSENESLEIIFRILKALAYLESKDIIHRDLKPENIIFRDKDNPYDVVIIDFGFATKVVDYKNLFTRCGTPGYVAPEVLNDFPYNTKADVFSAGIIFYILLTGCAPFYGDDYDEVVDKNLKADLNFNFEEIGLKFEDDTVDLLKSLLKKQPKSRLAASEALNHAAFKHIKESKPSDDEQMQENSAINNIKEFHEKYKFNIKKFPKVENNIPDNINDLNTPMLAADHRVIKPLNQVPTSAGLTPMLVGRTLNPDAKTTAFDALTKKMPLDPIKEDAEEEARKKAAKVKAASNVKNALKGL